VTNDIKCRPLKRRLFCFGDHHGVFSFGLFFGFVSGSKQRDDKNKTGKKENDTADQGQYIAMMQTGCNEK
jgi:hypothetical protein